MANWTDQAFPFASARPVPPGSPRFYDLVRPVAHAIAIDTKDELQAALRAIEAHPGGRFAAEMAALLDEMPPDLRDDTVAGVLSRWGAARKQGNQDLMLADQARWTQFFRDRYRRIVELSQAP
jgi:hypothetical protein